MRLLTPGIAHQDVETAERLHGLLNQTHAEGLLAQIAGNRDPCAPLGGDEFHDLPRVFFLVREIVDGHVRALPGEGDGGRAAHAGIAAGDQRLATGEAT